MNRIFLSARGFPGYSQNICEYYSAGLSENGGYRTRQHTLILWLENYGMPGNKWDMTLDKVVTQRLKVKACDSQLPPLDIQTTFP